MLIKVIILWYRSLMGELTKLPHYDSLTTQYICIWFVNSTIFPAQQFLYSCDLSPIFQTCLLFSWKSNIRPTPILSQKQQGGGIHLRLFTRSLSWAMRVWARLSSSRVLWMLSSLAASSFLLCAISFWIDFIVAAFTHTSSSRAETRVRNANNDTGEWTIHTDGLI